MDDAIKQGTVLNNRYRVETVIGSGGMGHVFKAIHLALNRPVAVKTLNDQFVTDERALKRFYQEAQIAGSLGNDNICEVIDIGTHNGTTPYLVMPLLVGKSLRSIIDNEGALTPERAVDICAQTLCALSAAHANGIIHRDLKPDNIFITHVGDRKDFVKLLDFGISKIMDPERRLSLTGTGIAAGTPQYMAPEQAEGSKNIDHRSDIFGAGCLLYIMLTGQRPFGGDMIDALRNIIAGTFPLPRLLNPKISRALEQVVLTAMARDPNKRYGSAYQMREALLQSTGLSANDKTHDSTVADTGIASFSSRPTRDLGRAEDLEAGVAAISVPAAPNRQRRLFTASVSGLLLIAAVALVLFVVQRRQTEDTTDIAPLSTAIQPVAVHPAALQPPRPVEPTVQPPSAPEPPPLPPLDLPDESSNLHKEDVALKNASRPKPDAHKARAAAAQKDTDSEDTPSEKAHKDVIIGKENTRFLNDYGE